MNNDVKINSSALDEFLKQDIGDFIQTTKSIDNTVKEMSVAQSKGELSPAGVQASLEKFLDQGGSVLETMTIYCNNMPDAESVNAFASLINSLSSAMNNIANLYKTEQTHRNRIELEEKKHELKLREIEFKEHIRVAKKDGDPIIGEEDDAETMVEVNTASIVNELINAKIEQNSVQT